MAEGKRTFDSARSDFALAIRTKASGKRPMRSPRIDFSSSLRANALEENAFSFRLRANAGRHFEELALERTLSLRQSETVSLEREEPRGESPSRSPEIDTGSPARALPRRASPSRFLASALSYGESG
jgi:hypothetical protein